MKSRLLEQNRYTILTVFLTFLQIIFFSPCTYPKVPFLYRWEDDDRICIWGAQLGNPICKSTETGETITMPDNGTWRQKKSNTKKTLSFKEKKDDNGILIGLEVEVHDTDGSFIKKVILNKEEIDDFRFERMSAKENYLIYRTMKHGKWTLWLDPLKEGVSPIPVFTQQDYILADLSLDETKFVLITTHQEWGHSILIIRLNDISDPIRVTVIEEPHCSSESIEWSPNGTYIAYRTERKAYLVSESGDQKVLLTDNIDSYFGFKWSENNLYFTTNDMLMETNLLKPEKPHILLKLPEGAQNLLTELSPDKSKISTVTQEASRSKGKTIFRLWWKYLSKNEPWKQLFEYNQVLQNPQR